jgi:cell division protein ZapA (FtsZ GTPase activity inhibitor)
VCGQSTASGLCAAEEGKTEEDSTTIPKKVRKVFNLETDFQEYTEDMDLYQRGVLSKDELDALFVANTDLLDIINNINDKISDEKIEAKLDELKEKFEHDRLIISKETFDIFGNIKNDNTKTQYIGSKSHRENEKDLLKILSINKSIELKEFKEKLKSIKSNLDSANQKIKSKADMYLYKVIADNDDIKDTGYEIFDINVENSLKDYNCGDATTLKIIKLNFLNNYPINYYTNCTLFDNTNKTLPIGMDLSTKAIIDLSDFDFNLEKQIDFKTNNYLNKDNGIDYPKTFDIKLLEYNVSLKDVDLDAKISKATNKRKKASAPKDED